MSALCPNCGYDLKVLETFVTGDFLYEANRNLLSYCGRGLYLTSSEHLVLMAILRAEGVIMKRGALAEVCGHEGDGNVVEVFITRIRKKLRAINPDHEPVETVRGQGYRHTKRK